MKRDPQQNTFRLTLEKYDICVFIKKPVYMKTDLCTYEKRHTDMKRDPQEDTVRITHVKSRYDICVCEKRPMYI